MESRVVPGISLTRASALAGQDVQQGRLAHVGPAQDGHAAVAGLLDLVRGEPLDHLVQQVADAQAVQGADGVGLAQAQAVELVERARSLPSPPC